MSDLPAKRRSAEQGDQQPLGLADRLALRPAEVADVLGVSERTVRGLLREIPHTHLGTAVVIPIDQLREWLRERAQQEMGAVDRAVNQVLDGLKP